MSGTKKEVYTSRFWRHGGSKHVIIPREVHEHMRLKEGDQIAMRVVGPLLIMRKITARMVLDTPSLPADIAQVEALDQRVQTADGER